MIQGIYTVLDLKAEAYMSPFCSPNDETAKRSIATSAVDPSHMFFQHPHDYLLVSLGQYDDSSATIVTNEAPISLGTAYDISKAVRDALRKNEIESQEDY